MDECLQCKNKFKASTTKMKFCSSSCRLKFHRSKPKKNDLKFISPVQTQVLYNAMFDMMTKLAKSSELGVISQKVADSSTHSFKVQNFNSGGSVDGVYTDTCKGTVNNEAEMTKFHSKPKLIRSFDNYKQLRAECENEDAWIELKSEILESDLSSKQKSLLTN